MIAVSEKYELFKSTLLKCCSNILYKSDDDFRYTLFEELPIDIISFLHNNTLDALIDEGYIDERIYNMCSELREMYMREEKRFFELSDINEIKSSSDFCKIVGLADEILNHLYI